MKDFTMSMYRSKEDLYKAKAEYYEELLEDAVFLLSLVAGNTSARMCLSDELEESLDLFLDELED